MSHPAACVTLVPCPRPSATLVAWHNVKAVLLEALLIGPPGLLALRLRHPDAWRRIARADRLARPTRPG